jgi:hypothetical protein
MKKIFITGDRSMDLVIAVGAVDAVIKDLIVQNNGDLSVATGNLAMGVERAVRYIVPDHAMNVFEYEQTAEGHVDFAEMFAALANDSDEIVFIHGDPSSSRIGKALFAAVPSEKITMPLQEVMISLL